jgi:hypothetical protein
MALGFSAGKFQINGASWPSTGPTVPVLLQILSGAQTAQSLLPAGSVYTLPSNKARQSPSHNFDRDLTHAQTIQLSFPANAVGNIGGPVCSHSSTPPPTHRLPIAPFPSARGKTSHMLSAPCADGVQ